MPLALVDLGDTLAECTPALEAGLARLGSSHAALGADVRRLHVMSAPGFWLQLVPRPAGFALLGQLREAGYRVAVLTKGPRAPGHVWADKVAWCRAHLPDVPVIITDDKSLVAGDLLVDDWLPYVEDWQRCWPGGRAIVPAQPWNKSMTSNGRRIRDDGAMAPVIAAWLRDKGADAAVP
ncbi:5' nucleotidase, NT5C type [Caenimonas sedimenti]|uniref:5' nucleotidase, NT5C type n=1 Tax=Caenimonas sedimenti TaxID=2596921 RepID=UPI0016471E49|nr:hypothetical protein [Caenimonas sedimenti]